MLKTPLRSPEGFPAENSSQKGVATPPVPTKTESDESGNMNRHSIVTFYERIGVVTRLETVRKRLEFQFGFQLENIQKAGWKWLVAGMDMRLLQATKFHQGINAGFGVKLGEKTNLLATYYKGFVPYSRFDTTHKTSWFGLGLYFDRVI